MRMQKSKALKRQAQMRFNAFESYIELSDFDFELSFKHVLVKVLPGSLSGHFFLLTKTLKFSPCFHLMPRSFHLLLVFGYHSFDGQSIHIHTYKFIF